MGTPPQPPPPPSDDGVHLGNFRVPQRTYEKSFPCKQCGFSIIGLGSLCPVCLEKQTLAELLRYQGQLLAMQPEMEVPVAKDGGAARHIALLGAPSRAFCGTKLTEKKKTRLYIRLAEVPKDVCQACCGIAAKAARGGYSK
jgi:hypothetical protein